MSDGVRLNQDPKPRIVRPDISHLILWFPKDVVSEYFETVEANHRGLEHGG